MARTHQPDWSKLDYVEVVQAVHGDESMDRGAFLAGPFRRYLEIGADANIPARARARAMEFARMVLADFCKRQDKVLGGREGLSHEARDLAATWFADKPDGEYMLEVLDGISTHNYRGVRKAE